MAACSHQKQPFNSPVMKNFLFLLALMGLLVLPASVSAQSGADGVVGIWKTQDGDAHIQIYKGGNGKYYGKIHWLEKPNDAAGKPRTDIDNPDESKRSRALMGLNIMNNFSYDAASKEWTGGTVYDSKSGNTYDGYLKLQADGTLYMKGYVMGMRWLGRSNIWTRIK